MINAKLEIQPWYHESVYPLPYSRGMCGIYD